MNELDELWVLIESDLARARKTLPDGAAHDESLRLYDEFIEHNELELVCDMLEDYAREHVVPKEFWIALHSAAMKMRLPERAARYGEKCSD